MSGTSSSRNALWVTFEGVDGAGKTGQLQAVADVFRALNHKVVTTREPGGTLVGAQIREIVLHLPEHEELDHRAEALLFAADRAQHWSTFVLPHLNDGTDVFQDRGIDSSVAYQGTARGEDPTKIRELTLWAQHDNLPDYTMLLDIDPEVSARRMGRNPRRFDRMEAEGLSFQQDVRASLLDSARQEPERFIIVDADQDFAAVTRDICVALLFRTGITSTPEQLYDEVFLTLKKRIL